MIARTDESRRRDHADVIALLKPGGSAATALYIVAFSMFIFGVKRGTHPEPPSAAT